MEAEEVREKLGLSNVVPNNMRGSGRTTKMLIKAVAYISNGKKAILFGHDYRMAKWLESTSRQYASLLGLDASLLMGMSVASQSWRGMHTKFFIDHYIVEEFRHMYPSLDDNISEIVWCAINYKEDIIHA